MEIIKIYRPLYARLKKMIAKRRGWNLEKSKGFERLKEDYFLQSRRFPIFVMADGVLLAIKPGQSYPVPSGAGDIAKIFCQSAIEHSEKMFGIFRTEDIFDIFSRANVKAGEYNKKRGRTGKTVNYFDVDYFSATAVFALVRNSELFWGAIGDTKILLMNKNGRIKVASSDQVEPIEKLAAQKFLHPKPQQKKIFQQKYYRNKISPGGKLVGYGVIDGEPEALQYVEGGKVKIKKGDLLFIFTDGFTPCFELWGFRKLFFEWLVGFGKKIVKFIRGYISENLPQDFEEQYRFLYKYAAEKSLFAIN